MAKFVEALIWLGIGTSGGLVFAVIFYLIARYLNTRDDRKEAKKAGTTPAGKSAHPLGAYSPECVEGVFSEVLSSPHYVTFVVTPGRRSSGRVAL